MFKSLLNTLPVLSGNFTIACKLSNISKQSKGKFIAYINEASIKPLDENIKLYKSVPVNLMNGKYSFDIKKYTSIIDIHKNVYKNNYTTFLDLDRTSYVEDHNKIFEYGCKRISYELNHDEWSFYAPFYINNFEDIPDYFIIDINKKDSTQVLKQIKIYIGKKKVENKLYYYLKRHIEQITDNVPITWQYNNKEIVIHNAIDYNNGVIMSRVIDSNSQILYSNHVTINEFDSMLNNLYYDNGFILSEVIPLSFEFTLTDFLDESELKYYQMNDFIVSGYYTKNGKKYPFNIFETNSHDLTMSYKEYDSDINDIVSTTYNLYNKNANNSLHEATNILLRNDNTISKQYCKWSNFDNEQYYTNNNISYSSSYSKYGSFPIYKNLSENNLKLKLTFVDDKLNAWVPNKEYFEVYKQMNPDDEHDLYSVDNECVIYNNMILNNISTWFKIWDGENLSIFDNIDIWSKISKFNGSCFYRGIIYQNLPKDSDYFAVLLKIQQKDISNSTIADIIITNTNNIDNYKNISSYELYNDSENKKYLTTNTFVKQVKSISELVENETYYVLDSEKNEHYIKLDDIDSVNNTNELALYDNKQFKEYFIEKEINNIVKPVEDSIINKIDSYILLDNLTFKDLYNYYMNYYNEYLIGESDNTIKTTINNLFEDIYYLDIYTGKKQSFAELIIKNDEDKITEYSESNLSKIFKAETFIYILKKEQIYDIITNLFLKIEDNNLPKDENYSPELDNILKLTNNSIVNFVTYANKYTFIGKNKQIIKEIKDYLLYYKSIYLNMDLTAKQQYYYIIDNSISSTLNVDYFKAYENNDYNGYKVYVDSYNLSNILSEEDLNTIKGEDNVNVVNDYYCKFLNLNHFKEYCRELNSKDLINNSNQLTQKEILDTVYCKRTFIKQDDIKGFKLVNKMSSLKDYIYDENENVSENIINELLDNKNITYNKNEDEFTIKVNNKTIICELFYKKELVELTYNLKNILDNIYPDKNESISILYYMYYYTFNDTLIYKHSFGIDFSINEEELISEKLLLCPVFDSIYLQRINGESLINTNNKFLSSLYDNLYTNNDSTMLLFKTIEYSKNNDEDIINEYIGNKKLYVKINTNFAEVEKTEDNSSIIHVYEHPITKKKYCYFLINEYLSNNTYSYNIDNLIYNNMTLNLINEKPFNSNLFLDVYPFVKNDIFLDISQQIKEYIVYPTHVKLKNIYKSVIYNNTNNTSIIQNNQTQYIYLNRYFSNIMPCFKEIDYIITDMYKKIYKVKGNNFTNKDNLVSYIKNSCNIYKNQSIYYVNDYNDLMKVLQENKEFNEYIPKENKHFMNNLLYYLPNKIEFSTPSSETIIYNDIEKYEDVSNIETSKIFEYFKNYIKIKYYKKIIDKNKEEDIETLLFLFKMYSYTIEKNIVKYDIKLNNKLYSITYKLSLK